MTPIGHRLVGHKWSDSLRADGEDKVTGRLCLGSAQQGHLAGGLPWKDVTTLQHAPPMGTLMGLALNDVDRTSDEGC